VEYLEKRLADLQIETAVEYHSRCIEHLVSVSHDPEAIFDENLLAASIILRFYEEVDGKQELTKNIPKELTNYRSSS
jgi:hypothetical protein